MSTNKESKTVNIGYIQYCVYCGEEAKQDESWEEYDCYKTHYCDCEGAQAAMKAKEDYDKAMSKVKYRKDIDKHLNKLEYQYELRQLKGKFNMYGNRLEDLPE